MIARLVLTDFRNHADAVLTPGRGFVVLTGENGAGKTNVLEAVSLLAPGRGLRRASLAEMARQGGEGGFGIAATLAGDTTLATGIEPGAASRRIVRINGAPAPAGTLAEWVTILWLTPAMDRLFVDTPGDRRRFLDRLTLALAPGHAAHASRYEAAMRARNRLLADDAPPDADWLAALEAQMAEHGRALATARHATVDALTTAIAAEPDSAFARAGLAIENTDDAPDLAAALAANRRRDATAGRTLTGPHRADLVVTHLAKGQPAALCSTGEQKALLLGLVLAHAALVAARTQHAPILLLDEVAAHLDPVRRAALFDRLAGMAGQVWMTGTEPALFDTIAGHATRYTVADGRIAAAG
ncbi:DNA replication and repair protein RecF [Hephaestia caeni]|uniref:DNA replication and repair protein RecF n=1 Tax=Hephaestia caeni TaxID=645617 RepID=A0A397P4S2_9SPHN|nr:DNA replication/repair protein RecF [Hephaestia caeni]RIA44242.1 DNA replication and repair protein RecF [Hephaestia caeni]